MELNVYPDYDAGAELELAEAERNYHLSKARYWDGQIARLKAVINDQIELQKAYAAYDVEIGPDDHEAAIIADEDPSLAVLPDDDDYAPSL